MVPQPDISSVLSVGSEENVRKVKEIGPYKLLETLGIGEFGKVKLAQHVKTGQKVAVKMIDKSHTEKANIRDKVEREIALLKRLSHPNIVKLFDVIETERHIGMVMEYASGGELFEYILNRDYLEEDVARPFFGQLVSSVHYMHQKGVVHRDLKLENVLLLDDQEHIVITDFGFANNCTGQDLLSTCCGSPCYAAPELLVGTEYVGPAVDIWSCGVVLYAMLCGFLPFDDHHNMSLLYKDMLEAPLMFPPRVSQDVRDLLRQMLEPNPDHRCDMETVLNHRWLESERPFLAKNVQMLEKEKAILADKLATVPKMDDIPKRQLSRRQRFFRLFYAKNKAQQDDTSDNSSSSSSEVKQKRRFTWSLTMRRGDRKRKIRETTSASCTRVHPESLLVFTKISDQQLLMLVLRVLRTLGIQARQTHATITCTRRTNDPNTIYGSMEDGREITFKMDVGTASPHGLRMVGMRPDSGEEAAYAFLSGKIMDSLELVIHGQCGKFQG